MPGWRLALLCLLLLSALATVARADSASSLLPQLRELQQTSAGADPAGYRAFCAAIAAAYGVKDVEQLRGRVFVAYIGGTDLAAQPPFYVFASAKERHSAASTVKIVLLAALIRTIEEGKLSWGDKRAGAALSDHAKRMVRVSNNDSANAILDIYSINGVNDWLARLGFTKDEIDFQRRFSASAKPGPPDNYATVAGLAEFWFLVAQEQGLKDMLSPTAYAKARAMLSNLGQVNTDPKYNDRLSGKFPKGVEFAHKTGSNVAVIGDGGIAFDGGEGFIIVAFDTKQNRGAMAKLGLKLLELHRR
jgi:beta-lactamase class A